MKNASTLLGRRRPVFILSVLACALANTATAQQAAAAPGNTTTERVASATTLNAAFQAAWQRQPEAASADARGESAQARRESANAWFPEPAALEAAVKSDRLNANQGDQEYAVGVVVPLWLPGEAQRSAALADAQARALPARLAAAMLRTAGLVRERMWAWERARIELALAVDRLRSAQVMAADVARRVRAGDLARVDSIQADAAVAAAQSAAAEGQGLLSQARQQLIALTGQAPQVQTTLAREALPTAAETLRGQDGHSSAHAATANISAQKDAAKRAAELVQLQQRANPELTIGTARARGSLADPFRQTFNIGIRWPLGAAPANRAKQASANAEVLELESLERQTRDNLLVEFEAAKQGLEAARQQADGAALRAKLANEVRGLHEKSFRAGETDLPTRLRSELEAADAQRHAARAQVNYAAAISSLRQALGLLPE